MQFAVGQKLPESLGSAINSEFSELNPVMAPDGKTLYFGRKIIHRINMAPKAQKLSRGHRTFGIQKM